MVMVSVAGHPGWAGAAALIKRDEALLSWQSELTKKD